MTQRTEVAGLQDDAVTSSMSGTKAQELQCLPVLLLSILGINYIKNHA